MNKKNKYILFAILGFLLLGCSPSPSIGPSIEPSVEPSTEPSVEPSITSHEDEDIFYIKNIEVSPVRIKSVEEDEPVDFTINYSKEVYSVDNFALMEFSYAFQYKYEIEYNGKHKVEELELSLNKYGFDILYKTENNVNFLYIDQKMNIPVECKNNKIIFYIRNSYDNRFNGVAGNKNELPYLEININKVKYNGYWLDITENNKYEIRFYQGKEIGLDIVKNTETEVWIDFNEYSYKRVVEINDGVQYGDYSYEFQKEGPVDIFFTYEIPEKNITVEVVRTLEIKFLKFEFNEEKPYFEYVDQDTWGMNAKVSATYSTHEIFIEVDEQLVLLYQTEDAYTTRYFDSVIEKILNKTFTKCIYIGAGYELDLTKLIKNNI